VTKPNLKTLPDLSRISVSTSKEHVPYAKLPEPKGWAILIEMARPKTESEGGIIFSDNVLDAQNYLQFTGLVVKVGEQAYRHSKFGDTKPWCKEGDWVVIGQHAGQQLMIGDRTFRMIDDDHVKAVLPDPSILKVYV